jgi:predicted Zn-dependent protease
MIGAWKVRCLCAGLLLVWAAGPAAGFQRSRDPDTRACLWWQQREVQVYLNQNCSVDVQKVHCENAIWTTLDQWNQPACSDFRFLSAGNTPRTDVGFDQDHWNDNINLIIWQESTWSRDPTAIALTTTTYDRLTGEIVDTDVEFNGVDYTFTVAESASVLVDIANTLTHEAGHMLGLDHSADRSASMYAYAPQGETDKRTLSQDDIDGLCHVYPTGAGLPACEGFVPPDDDGGCASASGREAGCGVSLLAFGLLAFVWRTRRKERG